MTKRILIVEDTIDLMENIKAALDMEGHAVWCAVNGAEALNQMPTVKPDLIITDLLMPVMNGFEFIAVLRSNPGWKAIPILVFSAMPPYDTERKVYDLGANYYLKKPCTLETLLDAVNKLL